MQSIYDRQPHTQCIFQWREKAIVGLISQYVEFHNMTHKDLIILQSVSLGVKKHHSQHNLLYHGMIAWPNWHQMHYASILNKYNTTEMQ